jgi:serine phosphatase RsbU (regulator of sigma subunit)
VRLEARGVGEYHTCSVFWGVAQGDSMAPLLGVDRGLGLGFAQGPGFVTVVRGSWLVHKGAKVAKSSDNDVEVGETAPFWRLATTLSSAVTLGEVAAAVAERGASPSGAVFANTAILDARTNRVRVVHGDSLAPDIAQRWSEFGLETPTPLCEAIRSGQPVLLGSLKEVGARYPLLLGDTVGAGLKATASLPLRGGDGPVLGAIGFAWLDPQAFSARQMSRLTLIARLTAQALERVAAQPEMRGGPADRVAARVLQEAFLPATLPNTDHLEVSAAYLPASDAPIGGDWYDAFPVDGGTCLVIGDVAGHGVHAVAVMAELRYAVRAFADEDPTPSRVVTRVNRMLCRLHATATATLIVAVWHPQERTLIRTNAGHPPVLRCRTGEFAFLIPGAGRGVMIGVDPDWKYGQESKVMRPGTTLLFYTDGLIEARGQSLDHTMERLRLFAQGRSDLSPPALCDDVLLWRLSEGPFHDDVCVVAARMA